MYDLIVIGGGPGGYSAAIRASQYGLKVALAEQNKLGGTCINAGCIPTKVYAHAASLINEIKGSSEFGINAKYNLDLDQLRNKKNSVIKSLASGISYLMEKNKIDIINGRAEFLDENTVIVGGSRYNSKNFIIATGSEPFIPAIEGINNNGVIISDEALEMKSIPKSILIVGAGIIGLEFANIYNALGSEVTIIEMLPDLLPMVDRDVAEVYCEILKSRNIKLFLNSKVEKIEKGLEVTISGYNEKQIMKCETALVAVGRKANINGVSALNLEIDKKGIKVNSRMQTSIDNIYCIGDVNGISQLAHVASYQGDVAVKNIVGEYNEAEYNVIPGCIYTDPEISFVGLNETEARKKYADTKIGTYPYSYSGRAQTMGANEGLIKVICEGNYDRIVGVQIIGKDASELIHEGSLAIKYELSVHELIESIHAHPTLSEMFKEACEDVLGISINK